MADECAQALAVASFKFVKQDRSKKLAYLKVINQSSYEQNAESIDLLIPTQYGPIGGNWSNFDEARSNYFNSIKFDLDEKESLSELQINPDPLALKAWSDCMHRDKKLICWIVEQNETFVKVVVEWDGGPGLRKLNHCKFRPDSGKIDKDEFSGNSGFEGQSYVVLKYDVATKRASGQFTGKAEGVSFTAGFKAALISPPISLEITEMQNAGTGNSASVSVTVPFEQDVRIYGFCTSRYQREGDPSGSCWVYLNGSAHPHTSADKTQMHSPYPVNFKKFGQNASGTIVLEWDFVKRADEGETVSVVATAAVNHAVHDTLFIAIDYKDTE
jgi:hypothetical protein